MSPAEQTAHLILWVASGVVMLAWLDCIWCRFQGLSRRLRKRWLPWALAAGILIATVFSVYMTIFWADGRWRIYDLLAQGAGGWLYRRELQIPLRQLGRIGDVVLLRPIWWIIHVTVTFVRLVVRIHVKVLAFFCHLAYAPIRKIFPSALQSRVGFMYNIANRRTRRSFDGRKSTNKPA